MQIAKKAGSISNVERVREAVIAQLIAASPASLPIDFIKVGVLYDVENVCEADVKKILNRLEFDGVVIKIVECESGFRYKLVDDSKFSSVEDDE